MINNNNMRGVSIESSTSTVVSQNIISQNAGVGLSIEGSNTNVTGNTFYRNNQVGILAQTHPVNISLNNFVDNGAAYPGEIMQVSSYVGGITLLHNFWSDWIVPDHNRDDIVDEPYTIMGAEGNQDNYPHVFIHPDPEIHILTRPTPVFPNSSLDSVFYYGPMNITWGPASDTFGHTITYSIQYSNDLGVTWHDLVSGLTETYYLWNTNTSEQDAEYTLRVVAMCANESSLEIFEYTPFIIKEHLLTEPSIVSPTEGEVIINSFTVEWNESIDTWNHNVTYSIYYSSDGGLTWENIAEEVRDNQHIWYIDLLHDGQYMIKIVAMSECWISNESVAEITMIHNNVKIVTRISGLAFAIIITCLVVIWYKRRSPMRET
jgi:hypothetical protein